MADNKLQGSASDKTTEVHAEGESQSEADSGFSEAPPDGFTVLVAPGGTKYLVPTFLTPATTYAYYRDEARDELGWENAAGGVSFELASRPLY
jgi:hypothetical protein